MKKAMTGIGGAFVVVVLLALSYFGVLDINDFTGGEGTTNPEPPIRNPAPETRTETIDGDWYEIYFTNPSCPAEEERVGGLEDVVVEDMLKAQTRVDIASFDFDLEPMVDALIELEDRGVEVRVVVDDEHTPEGTTNRLRRNGISVVEDQRSALMHNKFVVIDSRYLWTGSMNFASNGVYCNNNNLVRFDSEALATNYTAELEEMYVDREFGPRSPVNTTPQLTINGIKVENYFTAEEEVAATIARALARADEEILFMAFSFTNDEIGASLIERANSGVMVRGVFETVGSETQYSYYSQLEKENIPTVDVRQDGNGRIMHHKVFIIDRETVVFGSFNFSDNAIDSNDENLIIIHDPEFTSYFVEEFGFVWEEAKTDS